MWMYRQIFKVVDYHVVNWIYCNSELPSFFFGFEENHLLCKVYPRKSMGINSDFLKGKDPS